MSHHFKLTLIWLAGGTLGLFFALHWLAGAYVDGEFVPMGNDSYYHAHRILDLAQRGEFYEHDLRIDPPTGLWVPWPWAYDYLAGRLVQGLYVLGGIPHLTSLSYLAPAWVYVNAALLLGVGSALGLSLPLRLILLLCFAFSPLTQYAHGVGVIDHHYVEYSFVLATLWLTLLWAAQPTQRWAAVGLGMVLGSASAFHNGLFILQIPVLAWLGLRWLHRADRPAAMVVAQFGLALLLSNALWLSGSAAAGAGFFHFYLFSYFHLYLAAATALVALWFSISPGPSLRAWLGLGLLAVALIVPLVPELQHGYGFMASTIDAPGYAQIGELKSILGHTPAGALNAATRMAFYTHLLWLLPVTLLWALWVGSQRQYSAQYHAFAVLTLLGSVLLLQQFRLHYYGSFALYLPLLLAVHTVRWPKRWLQGVGLAGLCLILAAAHRPYSLMKLWQAPDIALDKDFALLRPLMQPLAQLCQQAPGLVVADHNLGNHILFHTNCATVANNFILTQQDVIRWSRLEAALQQQTPQQLAQTYPQARYLLVVRSAAYGAALRRLLDTAQPLPPGFEVLIVLQAEGADGQRQPVAVLLKLPPS